MRDVIAETSAVRMPAAMGNGAARVRASQVLFRVGQACNELP